MIETVEEAVAKLNEVNHNLPIQGQYWVVRTDLWTKFVTAERRRDTGSSTFGGVVLEVEDAIRIARSYELEEKVKKLQGAIEVGRMINAEYQCNEDTLKEEIKSCNRDFHKLANEYKEALKLDHEYIDLLEKELFERRRADGEFDYAKGM